MQEDGEALECFEKSLKLDPSRLEAKSEIAFIYLRQGRVDDSLNLLLEVTENSETAVGYYRLAYVYWTLGGVHSLTLPFADVRLTEVCSGISDG
jgi:tetratricopeptide (TPR) repeat protein